jgi:hypothetical protein
MRSLPGRNQGAGPYFRIMTMTDTPQRRGRRFETEVQKSIEKTGWRVFRQPASGVFGTRIGSGALTGDLRISAGEFAFRLECKRRRNPPLTLMSWLAGCDVLVIRADQGEATVFTTLARFEEILAAAAEHLKAPEATQIHPIPMPRARTLKSRPFPGKKTARSRQKAHR